MTAPVAVFGVGNRSRGDDALGPRLLDRLGSWLEARGLRERFDLFEEYQLQVENALDLEGRELALFIDAWRDAPAGAVLSRIGPAVTRMSCDTHRLEPGAVLDVHRRVTGREPPPAFALGVRAERFELGESLRVGDDGLLGRVLCTKRADERCSIRFECLGAGWRC